jgi:4-hydroxy-3-methylbut-2-en-1-yl diphosphate synthase IspG/GcpE
MAQPILINCPFTGLKVQHLLADPPEAEKDHYSFVACPACGRAHLVHNSTGKLLGEKNHRQAAPSPKKITAA